MRNVTIVLAVLALAGQAWATTYYWDDDLNPNNEWSADVGGVTNWTSDVIPNWSPNNDTACVRSAYSAKITVAGASAYSLVVGSSDGTTGALLIDGSDDALLYLSTRGTTVRDGSSITLKGGQHQVDRSGINVYATGTYNLEGGKLYGYSYDGWRISGDVVQIGGEAQQTRTKTTINEGGQWKISGGKIYNPNGGTNKLYLDGTLWVSGPDVTQVRYNSHTGSHIDVDTYTQSATGILKCEIAQPGGGGTPGITKIEITDSRYGTAVARFLSGSELDMVISAADEALLTPNVSYFDLLHADKIVDQGLGFATGDVAKWSMSLVDTDATPDGVVDTLRVTYVPEPATMVLLGIGGLGVLIRRRRV